VRNSILRLVVFGCAALFVLSVIATGGCKSSSTPPAGPSPSPTPIPSLSPGPSPSVTPTANYFVGLEYPSTAPTIDPTYGEVQGFALLAAEPVATGTPTPAPIVSQVVTVHCNQNIQFFNLDRTQEHTASSLGTASGMNWPTWNNPNYGVASPSLTAISYPNFSAGLLSAYPAGGFSSAVYSTGTTAGSFYFGDYFDYTPPFPSYPSMRTVINVLCP
jgi:hypothetical protein